VRYEDYAGATLSHELIKLSFVLRHPQASEEVVKLPLLLFETPHSSSANVDIP